MDSAGSVGRLSFTGRKGQIVYVDITASSFDSACGLISLQNAQDDTLTSGCVISSKGFLDRTVLPADGSYPIVLDPAGNATGSLRLKLTGAQDQSVESAVDEPSRHLAVAQAGARAVLSFAATTGEKVYVNVPSTTVADQCGALSLHAPDGETVGTGCLIGRRGGIDAVELKQTGVFTVVLDPVAGNTGSALVGVTKAVDQRGEITADGPAVTAVVRQSGAVSRFAFRGSAGQHIVLGTTGSTLPDDCGHISLRDSTGRLVTQGCLFADDDSVDLGNLLAAGEYSIVIDPAGTDTGRIDLRLTSG